MSKQLKSVYFHGTMYNVHPKIHDAVVELNSRSITLRKLKLERLMYKADIKSMRYFYMLPDRYVRWHALYLACKKELEK